MIYNGRVFKLGDGFVHELFAVVIFVIAYALIVTEKINRTIVALLAAVIMVFFGVFSDPTQIFGEYIDFNTIFLLMGMMIFVSIIKKSGIFEYLGTIALNLSKGSLLRLYIYLTTIVALVSSVLDNVTTILVIVPITLAVCDTIEVDPTPFVLGEIFSSNIGGASSLIGDPPNIMIGSAGDLSFTDFLVNLGPVLLIIFVVSNAMLIFLFRKTLFQKKKDINSFHMGNPLKHNKRNFMISVYLLIITVVLFVLQEAIHVPSSMIAILAAMLAALLIKPTDIEKSFSKIEWTTLLFFVGLFIMVGGLEETGVLDQLANLMLTLSKGSFKTSEMLFLNVSGFASAFVDNIPYTATMIPIVESMQEINPVVYANLNPIWWALSLGACLGGNGTAIGASANVVGLAILKKSSNKPLKFIKFMGYGMLVLVVSLLIASAYLLIFF